MVYWTNDQRKRIKEEAKLLQDKLDHFTFSLDKELQPQKNIAGEKPFSPLLVSGFHQSSIGKWYKLVVSIDQSFPYQMPGLYVTYPCPLIGFEGKTIPTWGTSAKMDVWKTDRGNYTKICHCRAERWSAKNSIVSVLLKGFLWLEAFELHCQAGASIDMYSISMEGHN